MTIAAPSLTRRPWRAPLTLLRTPVRRRRRAPRPPADEVVLRALCHDMRSPLASLEALLHHLHTPAVDAPRRAELIDVARAQIEHLSSMLRTATATGGALDRRSAEPRRLTHVVTAAAAASGLSARQLHIAMDGTAAEVAVADPRVQRIVTNLLENAHRHGRGAPVRLEARCRRGWVRLSVAQTGVPAHRVLPHLRRTAPPSDLAGLGLWSVRQQAADLGGDVSWAMADGGVFTFHVDLPDR